jgi:hypothetical protein
MVFARKNSKSGQMSNRKARELMVLDRLEQKMASKDIVQIRLAKLMEAGLKHNETLWFGRGKKKERFESEARDHPEIFRAKNASFNLMLSKVLPSQINHKIDDVRAPRVTADQLEQVGLTDDQIKQLAGLGGGTVEIEDAEVVE